MKVLHIITGLNVGGAENMLCKLLENRTSPNIGQAVLSLLDPGPLGSRVRESGTPLYTVGMSRTIPGPAATFRMMREIRAIAPDVLHGWMYHGNLAASFARFSMANATPLIWNVRHSLADPARENGKTRAILKASAGLSGIPSTIIYNSSQAASEHERAGYSSTRREIVPNGFDFDTYRPATGARERLCKEFGIDPAATIVASVARHHPMKNHAMLVDAVAKARAADNDLHLVMIGAGITTSPELSAQVSNLLPPDRVTLSEARADLSQLMPGFDVLAVSSAWGEGFPNVIGEALACEVPVVATDVGDSAHIVEDDGIIVPPDDAPAFAAALGEMIALGHAGRKTLGRRGRERTCSLYGIRQISRQFDDCYKRAASEGGRARSGLKNRGGRAGAFPR